MDDNIAKNQESLDWFMDFFNNNKEVTKTIYDAPLLTEQAGSTSRKRVVANVFQATPTSAGDSTFYSYDVNGNAKSIWQSIEALRVIENNGRKRIDYDYDLVSGKVNRVVYQLGEGDQFFYKYLYDAENRIIEAQSGRDGLLWNTDASYRYYLHGQLARIELGHYKVQGIDYAYTLQGWLKGMNGVQVNPANEIAGDGKDTGVFSRVSRDVYGFSLGYFANDYKPIGGAGAAAFRVNYQAPAPSGSVTGSSLFNGNISYATLALSGINNGAPAGYTYLYDQLNRLTGMSRHALMGTDTGWSNTSIIDAYKERINYDANGNILSYIRNGAGTTHSPLAMDNMTYRYLPGTNKLDHIDDSIAATNHKVDIDDQDSLNYVYDAIGNLIRDVSEGIDSIQWTIYGKVEKIKKDSSTITYGYDANGNRVTKVYAPVNGDTVTTFYVRDAQGNPWLFIV